jgi:hypothetical protein
MYNSAFLFLCVFSYKIGYGLTNLVLLSGRKLRKVVIDFDPQNTDFLPQNAEILPQITEILPQVTDFMQQISDFVV